MAIKLKLLSIPAAAIAGGVSKRSIERWLAEGRLTRYERPGRIRVLVDAAELRELVTPKAVIGSNAGSSRRRKG
ncbi:MAG TPA: hypothetical protein VNF26_05230 [Candidatus Baltobacterales bacterium]|nr:hypothetical protein [Candidatus Baltobacterales bacterium]